MIEAIAQVAAYQNAGLALSVLLVLYVIVCEHTNSNKKERD